MKPIAICKTCENRLLVDMKDGRPQVPSEHGCKEPMFNFVTGTFDELPLCRDKNRDGRCLDYAPREPAMDAEVERHRIVRVRQEVWDHLTRDEKCPECGKSVSGLYGGTSREPVTCRCASGHEWTAKAKWKKEGA